MKVHKSPAMVDYLDQVMRRNLLICDWLGMSPGALLKINDGDPTEWGEVEVAWEATSPQLPIHGKVIGTGARGGWGEPTIHSGTLVLHPIDARELLQVAGLKPEFPMSAQDRASLERLR